MKRFLSARMEFNPYNGVSVDCRWTEHKTRADAVQAAERHDNDTFFCPALTVWGVALEMQGDSIVEIYNGFENTQEKENA